MEKQLKKKRKQILDTALMIGLRKGNPTILKMLIERAFPKVIKAKTPNDIIRLIGKGKITLSEARDFMAVLKDKAEIEELPVLLKKLEELEKKT